MEPGDEVLIKPSRRIITTRRTVDMVERSEGNDNRWRGRRVVGMILDINLYPK